MQTSVSAWTVFFLCSLFLGGDSLPSIANTVFPSDKMVHKGHIVYFISIERTWHIPNTQSKLTQSFTPVCMHAIPPHRSRHAPPSPSKFPPVAKPASAIICAKSPWLGNRRIDSTRYWYDARSPARIVPSSGITENEYWSYILRCALSEMIGDRLERGTYCASAGFVTLLNSRQANVPPGLSTRCASRSTSAIEVTFRIPNAIV